MMVFGIGYALNVNCATSLEDSQMDKEMSFEEQFPNLSKCEFLVDGDETEYYYVIDKIRTRRVMLFRDMEIKKHCLSKQIVREAIENCDGNMIDLKEELGL